MYYSFATDSKLEAVVKSIQSGNYGDAVIFEPLLGTLRTDYYLLSKDFTPCKKGIEFKGLCTPAD